ncbi:efflux RND transporter periplasmic adaptor subunit [Roseococcus sp. YIM B11640]|uniref:efflux RND transporter periplasmic adaptor subunit n=1 Tax=Roseococcus sp. YIM B11640 TaxID=3133973 RepID=UPI003C7C4361
MFHRLLRPAALACALILSTPVLAHEGHDEAAAASAPARPRVAVHTELYELVAVREAPDRLRIWLDLFADNAPVADARIRATLGDATLEAGAQPDGTYLLADERLAATGSPFEFVFDVSARAGDDLIVATLPALPPPDPHHGPQENAWLEAVEWAAHRPWFPIGGGAVAGFALALLLRPRRRRVAVGLALLVAMPAQAGPGHDPGPEPAAASTAAIDTPQRLPDGSVFLPKVSQRLLELRTVTLRDEEARRAVTLVGRVVADPNRGGLAQSIAGGRVAPPEGGLPRLGQQVRRGDILALVEPPLPIADRTTIAERTGEIDQLIAGAEARLTRARSLVASGAGTRVQVVDTEIELEGLRRRRALIGQTRVEPEAIRAPADGIIAVARVVAGQVVQAQDVLFQILDPGGLWVEALVYGPDAARLEVQDATAAVGAGEPMRLTLQGFGQALQQQAILVQFRVEDPPPGLALGQPVRVVARLAENLRGLVLPRAAVVRAANGESIVWRHVEPESFVAAPVRVEPVDAARVLVASGLSAGERVVVQGAGLVNQIR